MSDIRWTRAKYRKAAHLARFFGRHMHALPSHPPALLQSYFALWERYPQRKDPLAEPLQVRLAWFNDMPF